MNQPQTENYTEEKGGGLVADILIVEDDLDLGNLIEEVLGRKGYSIKRAYSGSEAILLLASRSFDLILLDLMLPGADGETVLKKTGNIPVLVISSRNDIPTKVSLLMAGASDFLEKPFDLEELQARVVVQLRKNTITSGSCLTSSSEESGVQSSSLSWNGLVLEERLLSYDPNSRAPETKVNQKTEAGCSSESQILLSFTEALILSSFLQAASRTLTRGRLLEILDENDRGMSYESLKVHLSRLRRKLKDLTGKEWIESIWGIGYHLSSNDPE